MPETYDEKKVIIDRSWTFLPSDIIQAIIFDEYGLTFKEWQEKGLPFPEEKKEEYFEQVEKNGGKLLPYSLYQNKLTQ